MGAARWLLVSAGADASSVRGIQWIAERIADARTGGHRVDFLGVVLTSVPSAARRVWANAVADITAVLGGAAPLISTVVRSSNAVARECRAQGVLAHELAERLEGSRIVLAGSSCGYIPQRVPGNAPARADDYVQVTEPVLRRLDELEAARGAA